MASSIMYWMRSMIGLSMNVSIADLISLFIMTTGGFMYSRSVSSDTPQIPTTSLIRSMMSSSCTSLKNPSAMSFGGGSSSGGCSGAASSGFFFFAPHMKPQKGAGATASSGASWVSEMSNTFSLAAGPSLSISSLSLFVAPYLAHMAPLSQVIRSYLMFDFPVIWNPLDVSVNVRNRCTFLLSSSSMTFLSTEILMCPFLVMKHRWPSTSVSGSSMNSMGSGVRHFPRSVFAAWLSGIGGGAGEAGHRAGRRH
mmetsp:Transcript_71225/g.201034  ORF Transcript_71225/g.201034 Transcript_71225/m.201034 type:complete len:253 (-) Transcript_71225:25-783(-)